MPFRPVVTALASLAAVLCAAPAPASPEAQAQGQLQLQAIHQGHPRFADRLEAVSRSLVGRPFARSPLGEGPQSGPDPDPIMDLSRFDCVTYVEQVMALSWQGDLERASALLQRIRYTGGEIRYGARKHVMMAQWIPQNVAAGFVRDVTAEVADEAMRYAHLSIAASDFERGPGRRLRLAAADRPVGRFTVPIVPAARMAERLGRVPTGTIVTTIRARRPGVPYRASHVGVVVVVGAQRRFRHADARSGRVLDEPLLDFVERARRYRRWPVVGFHLLRIASKPPSRVH